MALRPGVAIAADFVGWAVVQGGCGYLAYRVPLGWLRADGWIWREHRFEESGRLYVRLGIRRWKRLLPDAGQVFAGGFAKRRLSARDTAYLARFAEETRRAELTHLSALALTPLFALWNPPSAMPLLALYAVAVNLPCVAAQRYNRIRLRRILDGRAGRRVAPAPLG